MKKFSQAIVLLCLTLASATTINGMHTRNKRKKEKVGKIVEEGNATQLEKYCLYQDIITPIVVEAEQTNGKCLLNVDSINDAVFLAMLRDTTRMFKKRTIVPGTYGPISLAPVHLDEIVRLIKLCDFLKSGERYKTHAVTLERTLKDYCSDPASKPTQIKRLATFIKSLIDAKKTNLEPKRKDL